ncbi:YncE family protein [candidate division WOR-3 bacterium]|nr:YncE family protein [candidate division WOR-3 bacterium]
MHSARLFCLNKKSILFLIFLFLSTNGCKKEDDNTIFIDPEEPIILVVNSLGETLSIIHLNHGEVDNDILTLGSWTNQIVTNANEDTAYIVNSGENNIQVIEICSLEEVCLVDIGIGNNPWHIAIKDTLGFVTNFLTNTVSVINLNTYEVIDTISVGIAPEGILTYGSNVYVANCGYAYGTYEQGTVSVIDVSTKEVTATINVSINPQEIAVDPQGNLHVVCTGDYSDTIIGTGKINIIDPNEMTVIDTVFLGGSPTSVAFTPNGIAYVVGYWGGLMSYNWQNGTVLHGVDDPILERAGLFNIVFDPNENNLYICNFEYDCVLSFNLADNIINETYDVGDGPVSISLRK